MSSLLRISIRLAIIFVIIFAVIQPFNWFCQLANKCEPFFFTEHFFKREGMREITLAFEVQNYREDLDFKVNETNLTTVSNRKNTINFHAKNLSNRPIRFRPMLHVVPESALQYITRYECLCFHEYKLNGGEEIDLKMKFRINEKFLTDNDDKIIDVATMNQQKKAGEAAMIKIIYKTR